MSDEYQIKAELEKKRDELYAWHNEKFDELVKRFQQAQTPDEARQVLWEEEELEDVTFNRKLALLDVYMYNTQQNWLRVMAIARKDELKEKEKESDKRWKNWR